MNFEHSLYIKKIDSEFDNISWCADVTLAKPTARTRTVAPSESEKPSSLLLKNQLKLNLKHINFAFTVIKIILKSFSTRSAYNCIFSVHTPFYTNCLAPKQIRLNRKQRNS